MVESRPAAAYTLALVGAILQAVATLFILVMVVFAFQIATAWQELVPERLMPWMMGHWLTGYPFTTHPVWATLWIASAIIISGLSFYGAVMMNSTGVRRVRTGATIVLIISIIALPTMWGFMIGSLLMFIGSILGLTWTPPAQPAQT
jgi:hypothetical protein